MEGIIVWGIVILGLIFRVMKLAGKNKSNTGAGAPKTGAPVKTYGTNIDAAKGDTTKGRTDKNYSGAMIQRETSAMPYRETSAMPHKHREKGVYDTANRHKKDNSDGTMPHSHNEVKYKSIDVATLPKGYILLNGEPVRTADLEKY